MTSPRMARTTRAGRPATGRDRRRFERVDATYPIRVLRAGSEHERVGITKNVSAGGILFRARGRYEVGDRLWIGGSHGAEGDSGIFCLGEVVRVSTDRQSRRSEFPHLVAVELRKPIAA